MTTDLILTAWQAFMTAEDLTDRTITERIRFIRHVEATTGRTVLDITRNDLIGYMGTKGWSNATRQHYRSALHGFFTWLQDEGYRPDNPAARLPKVRARIPEPNPVSIEDIQRLLEVGMYWRTKMMILLHYFLGLRVSEIAAVHSRDIDTTNRTLTTTGKGRKTRILPIPDPLWPYIKRMPDGWWFPNSRPNKMFGAYEGHVLGNSVGRTIGDAMRRAGLAGHHAHHLRAATATLMSRAGVDPFVVQKAMRHERMDTTVRYRLVNLDEVRAGFNRLPTVAIPERSGRAA